jgi:tetratricopeptide (TPR) repeat protein
MGKVDLEATIEAARTDVFSKYPNADKIRAQAYFAYVFCTSVLTDPTLSAEQRLRYSVLLLPDSPATASIKHEALKAISAGAPDRAELLATAARDQVSAVLLIEDGHPDLALDNLQQAERLLGDIQTDNSAKDRLQRGYIYKTYAQGFAASGDVDHEQQYLGLALKTFEEVKSNPNLDKKTTREFAGAINGIGNIHYQRGQFRESIADYQLATSLVPDYAYAWHDMFLAYFALAKIGEVDLPAMRKALGKTKENAAGSPGLDAKRMAQLEAMLAQFERPQTPNPKSKRRR